MTAPTTPPATLRVPALGSLWRTWFLTVTTAELLGFTVPAVVGALLADAPIGVLAPALVAAGVAEGTALGAGQGRMLCRALPGLRRGRFLGRFVAATATAAAVAYAIAMVPAVLGERMTTLPLPVLLVVGLVLGGGLLASIGTAQWLVLRSIVPRSAFWIATTAGAWVVGLGAFVAVTSPLWQPGQASWLVVAIGLLGGLVMAAVAAALSGLAFLRLVDRGRS